MLNKEVYGRNHNFISTSGCIGGHIIIRDGKFIICPHENISCLECFLIQELLGKDDYKPPKSRFIKKYTKTYIVNPTVLDCIINAKYKNKRVIINDGKFVEWVVE